VKPPDAAHHPLWLPCKYARNCPDELSRRLHVYKATRVIVENQRARLLATRIIFYFGSCSVQNCSFSRSNFIISLLRFLNLLGCAGAPNLLDVLLPPAICLDFQWIVPFSLKPTPNILDFQWILRTGRSRKHEEDIINFYMLSLVHKLTSLTLNFFVYIESAHASSILLFLVACICSLIIFTGIYLLHVPFESPPKIYLLHGIFSPGIFHQIHLLKQID
jgi:hypothetical protein